MRSDVWVAVAGRFAAGDPSSHVAVTVAFAPSMTEGAPTSWNASATGVSAFADTVRETPALFVDVAFHAIVVFSFLAGAVSVAEMVADAPGASVTLDGPELVQPREFVSASVNVSESEPPFVIVALSVTTWPGHEVGRAGARAHARLED